MFKTVLKLFSVIALSLLCVSCASLKCKHFPGERESITEKELSEESIWKFGDEIYHVQVVSSNKVVASSVEWDDKTGKHKLESFEVVPSKLDDTIFLNLNMDGLYTILRVLPAGEESLVLLTIDSDKVEEDIEKGRIKGSGNRGEFILTCSKKELDEYIKANLNTLFSLDGAGVLKLINGKME